MKTQWIKNAGLATAVAVSTLAAIPVTAATSFPQTPLIGGSSRTPPNILLILDDSGSMESFKMPADNYNGLADSVSDRSYINNTLFYNALKSYEPWRTALLSETAAGSRLDPANIRNAASSTTSPTSNPIDLANNIESIFYYPKAGQTSPGTTTSKYDKFQVRFTNQTGNVGGIAVQKPTNTKVVLDNDINQINYESFSNCFKVGTSGYDSVLIETGGDGRGNADIYIYSNKTCSGNPTYIQNARNSDNYERFDWSSPPADLSFRIRASFEVRNGDGERDVEDVTYKVTLTSWTNATPTGRGQSDEIQNFANWFVYHRTRNKTAKAGASEAFGALGSNYRVGFDTIWNRNKDGIRGSLGGSAPAYPIPWGSADGLFLDDASSSISNRTDFFARLHAAGASGATPLHGALQRAARYFATNDPWKNSTGALQSCRQNYALLTTDGYWNSKYVDGNDASVPSGYTSVGDTDTPGTYPYRDKAPQGGSDTGYADTLADVAYKYWKEDMRTDMLDNVRTTAKDPNSKQHMVTFGISIGLEGSKDQTQGAPSTWPNPNDNEDKERIDDLWHASINGHGEFVVASDSESFATALASALSAIDSRTASGSNIASTSTETKTSTLTFSAQFTTGSWIGDLKASPFNAAGTAVSSTPTWVLSTTFVSGEANANFTSREIISSIGGTAQTFDSNMSNASSFARDDGSPDSATAAENIAYISGVNTLEVGQANGKFRSRDYPFGDIIYSSPMYSSDTDTVYIGANDGMLHGIDSADGEVLFSYIPAGVDPAELAKLSKVEYQHRYFVDGQIDVMNKADQGNGVTLLVGAMGRGGKGVFALDVTAPQRMGADEVLWDNTFTGDSGDDDMGYVFGNVRIRKTNKLDAAGNKVVMVFVPNGIDSESGKAVVFAYELGTSGQILATHKLTGGDETANGMMGLGMGDLDGNGTVDVVYGGDLKGNVWKWDLATLDATNPMPSTGTALFNTDQPITGGLGVAKDTSGQVYVAFGTGQFIFSSDVPGAPGYTAQTQSLYSIKDQGTEISGRNELQSRTFIDVGEDRFFQNYATLPAAKKGWYIDLTEHERVTTSPTIVDDAMHISSQIPPVGSDCNAALGGGYVMAINVFTGTSPQGSGYYKANPDSPADSGNDAYSKVGGKKVTGGMPTEVNVTTNVVTVGKGDGSLMDIVRGEGTGGLPARLSWREVVQPDN